VICKLSSKRPAQRLLSIEHWRSASRPALTRWLYPPIARDAALRRQIARLADRGMASNRCRAVRRHHVRAVPGPGAVRQKSD